jgi:hypothetical protein
MWYSNVLIELFQTQYISSYQGSDKSVKQIHFSQKLFFCLAWQAAALPHFDRIFISKLLGLRGGNQADC